MEDWVIPLGKFDPVPLKGYLLLSISILLHTSLTILIQSVRHREI